MLNQGLRSSYMTLTRQALPFDVSASELLSAK